MVVGVDFDNTIVCHDGLFFDVGRDMGLVPDGLPRSKNAVRQHVMSTFSNDAWTLLQAHVYGERLDEAPCYPGVLDFFASCRAREVPAYIVSHKTQFPAMGARCDLRRAAFDWLDRQGFFAADGIRLPYDRVFFVDTRADKLAQIARIGCTCFIDDLPDVLDEAAFPEGVRRILFDPDAVHVAWRNGMRAGSWAEIVRLIEKPA